MEEQSSYPNVSIPCYPNVSIPCYPNVSIPCYNEQRDKKKRYTVYKVMVNVGRHEWFVFRRYAEFDKLYNTLRKQFPSLNLKIPPKRIFGDNFDPEFIKQRRTGLHEFIQRLVSHPQLRNQPDVRAFLQMDKSQNFSDPLEDDKNGSTSRNINLGPSGNPHAKPTDFDFLKVIGKGSFGKCPCCGNWGGLTASPPCCLFSPA